MLQLAESPLRESFAHPRPAGGKVAMKASYRLPQLLLLAIDFREMITSFISAVRPRVTDNQEVIHAPSGLVLRNARSLSKLPRQMILGHTPARRAGAVPIGI